MIRFLAQELYRLEREVSELEKKLDQARPEERDALEMKLRRTRKERDDMRGRLEAKKEPPTYRTTFF